MQKQVTRPTKKKPTNNKKEFSKAKPIVERLQGKKKAKKKKWGLTADEREIKYYTNMLDANSSIKVQEALVALGARKCTSAFDKIRSLLQSPSELIRKEAIWALGEQLEGRAVPDLIETGRNADASDDKLVVREVITALGKIHNLMARIEVERYLSHNDEFIKEKAEQTMKLWLGYWPSAKSLKVASKVVKSAKKKAKKKKRKAEPSTPEKDERDAQRLAEWREKVSRARDEGIKRREKYLEALSKGIVLTDTIFRRLKGPWSDKYYAMILSGKVLTAEVFYIIKYGEEHIVKEKEKKRKK